VTAAPIAERFSCATSFFSNHLQTVGTSHILGTKLFSFSRDVARARER